MASSTGVLHAAAGTVTNRVYFSHGAIVAASSSQQEQRLGSVLLRMGLIDQQRLEKAVSECRATPLGQHLLDTGVLNDEQLARAARTLIRGVLGPMFNWPEGRWHR